jgi:hypothetical protein
MPAIDAAPAIANRANTLKLGALGAVCGAISWAAVIHAEELHLAFWHMHFYEPFAATLTPFALYPGLVFGIVFGLVLARGRRMAWLKGVGFVLASFFCYLVAYHLAVIIAASAKFGGDSAIYWIGVPAGFAGSAILSFFSKLLFRWPGKHQLVRTVVVGTLAGACSPLATIGIHHNDYSMGLLAFFVLWQGAYGASLAPLLSSDAQRARDVHLFLNAGGRFSLKALMPSF